MNRGSPETEREGWYNCYIDSKNSIHKGTEVTVQEQLRGKQGSDHQSAKCHSTDQCWGASEGSRQEGDQLVVPVDINMLSLMTLHRDLYSSMRSTDFCLGYLNTRTTQSWNVHTGQVHSLRSWDEASWALKARTSVQPLEGPFPESGRDHSPGDDSNSDSRNHY